MTPEELERLLKEEESAYLEFKEKLDLANKADKASFLKEILALVNTPHSPSFLIFGVEDKTKNLIGMKGLTEEQLQQIVAEYCKPLIPFSFKVVEYKGTPIGVMQIFRSNFKPHVLKARFSYLDSNGKPQEIRDNQIFTRHGSIVAEATREELIVMTQDRETNSELLARIVTELEKMGAGLLDTNYALERIEGQIYDNRPRQTPDRVIEGVFVSIITGSLACWLSLSLLAPILWFAVGIAASALKIIRYDFLRTVINSIVLGALQIILFRLLSNIQFVGTLLEENQSIQQIVLGGVIGAISGVIGSFLLLNLERRSHRP